MPEKIKFDKNAAEVLKSLPTDLRDEDSVKDQLQSILDSHKESTGQPQTFGDAPEEYGEDVLRGLLSQLLGKPKKASHRAEKESALPDSITTTLEAGIMKDRTITEWHNILTKECQVYVAGQQYLAKRFDEVYYKYCGVKEATEILTDNLYAILKYKYFPQLTDEILERIDEIVRGLTRNIKTFLTKVSFEDEETRFRGTSKKRVPNWCVAFANGVFDFKKNDWLFTYERVYIPSICNTIILYNDYIIEWNFDFDFDPLPINIMETSFDDFISMMKSLNEGDRNYCFELFYNMSHDRLHRPSKERMVHLAEILGFSLIPQFLQYFILLIGAGQNGKNSLFDGCFSAKVLPRPVANSIETIENDRFITESLSNAHHNIFLETSAKVYKDSNVLKALTGSMYQTIECKGIGKYAGVINCKYIFAGNDQANIKFTDTTIGFKRRINLFEIYYSWDPDHRFMKYGSYYQTDFSGDLHELKNDITNTICYIYLGMYGILSATKRFTRDFKFTHNEWNDSYSDIDVNIQEFFNSKLTIENLFSVWGQEQYLDESHQKAAFYDDSGLFRIYSTPWANRNFANTYERAIRHFKGTTPILTVDQDGNEKMTEEPNAILYFKNKDMYVSLSYLRALAVKYTNFDKPQREFNDQFKRIYQTVVYKMCTGHEQYVKIRLQGEKIKFVLG